ncbi:MAG: DUF2723 domain-containing protein [Verrucomicrobiota bacterium]
MLKSARLIPWWIGLGGLLFYGLTISHGLTVSSLNLAAKVAGWDWLPMVGQPVVWLLTLPLRLLPAAWVPLGLNIFSVACGAMVLAVLARTVQLLPWDASLETGNQWIKTLPLFVATALCGLEFSFWQEATAATGEMLDLLLLAVSLWLLLEYRNSRQQIWLNAAVVVWGLGMAENWLMLLALPVFVGGLLLLVVRPDRPNREMAEMPLFIASMIWFDKLRTIPLIFFVRLIVLGLAGFSVYACLPFANGLAPHAPWSLAHSWHFSLKQSKDLALLLYHQFFGGHRLLLLAVILYFLVPTLSCLVRQRDEDTWDKSMMEQFEIWMYRGLRGILLFGCVWLALDPISGLRQIIHRQSGITMPLLTFDYINALGAAFLAGQLLLISQKKVPAFPVRPAVLRMWRSLAVPMVATGILVLTGILIGRNAPAIFSRNTHPLEVFGQLAVDSLPAGSHGLMLSDQPQKLVAFQAALAHRPQRADWLAVDLRNLPTVEYRAWLQRQQPAGWLAEVNRHPLNPLELMQLFESVARTNRVFLLQSSFGYFFERFQPVPGGTIFELKAREPGKYEISGLPDSLVASNEANWTHIWQTELASLMPAPARRPVGWRKKIPSLGVTAAPRVQNQLLAEWFSTALDSWGVALQQNGRWPEARLRLGQSLQLNSNNISARISLDCNSNLVAGTKTELSGAGQLASQLESLQRLGLLLNNYGPFDDPFFCYLLGTWFQKNGLVRQALEQYERARTLAPALVAPKLALAEMYTRLQLPDRARPLVTHLRDAPRDLPANSAVDLEIALMEADSWLAQTNTPNASRSLQSVLEKHPEDSEMADRIINAFLLMGDFDSARQLVDSQLAKTPNDVHLLNSQAAILIQSGHASDAIPVLDHVLAITNLVAARLNRANARLVCQDYALAETDFRELEQAGAEPGRVCFGLATIARHRQDTNHAIHYLQSCLTNTTSGSTLWRQASNLLQELAPSAK